jgi:hypothetical protein
MVVAIGHREISSSFWLERKLEDDVGFYARQEPSEAQYTKAQP